MAEPRRPTQHAAYTLMLLGLAGCAHPSPRTAEQRRSPAPITDRRPATLTEFSRNPLRIYWKSTASLFRKTARYVYSTDRSAPNAYLAAGAFHYFDPDNIRISYQTAGDGFTYREVLEKEVSFHQKACPIHLPLVACVEDHTMFIALELVCGPLPCAGKVRVYDAYQPLRSLAMERHISQIWRHFVLGKRVPSGITPHQEHRFSVAEGSEMGDYLVARLQFVFDAVEKIKRENPRVLFQ